SLDQWRGPLALLDCSVGRRENDSVSVVWARDWHVLKSTRQLRDLYLPGVVHRIGHDLLALRRNLGAVLDRLRVLLAVLLRFLGNLPVAPAIEALDHSDLRRRIFLVVTDLDLESFVHPFVIGIYSEAGAATLANQIEA